MRSRASIVGLLVGLALSWGCSPSRGAPDAATRDAARIDVGPIDAGTIREPTDAGPVEPAFDEALQLDDGALAALDPGMLPVASTACRPPTLMRVAWVTDGDTITVEDPDTGAQERVRIIGIDTPEIAHDATTTADCYGPEAHAFTTALSGHLVWLTFEAGCLDRFDRTLAHVHVSAAPEGSWGRQILRRGLGRTLFVRPNRAFEALFTADLDLARSEPRGLWAVCP